jgi:NADPH:quinone reductase-like Zn-dependent oxidoreductase
MKAAEIREFGIDKIVFVDRPEPKPGPNEVLVRIQAASLNYRDLMVARGDYNPRLRMPMVPLSDGAGEVVDTGPGVSRAKQGDRVAGIFMQQWIDGEPDEVKARSALGGAIDGVAAEYVVFHENGVVRIPEHLSYEEAATLPCTGVTAWNAVVTSGHVRPDEWVLALGTGGVSIYAMQFAKLMHACVIVTSSSDAKLSRARELGADETINYRSTPDWDKRVREISGGRGVDNVIEVGGGDTLPKSMKAVRMGGAISLIGVLSGKGDVNFVPVFMRSIRMQGIFVGSREMFEDMSRAVTAHELKPVIDRVFPFSELREAMRYMESGAHFGKICVSFG